MSFVLSRSCRFFQNDHQKSKEIKSTLETGNAGMEILQVMEALPVKRQKKKKKNTITSITDVSKSMSYTSPLK